MNAHLQRLLARVGPPTAGLALGALPVNPVSSPLAEADQRISLPEFVGLSFPSEVDAPLLENEAAASPAPVPKSDAAPGAPTTVALADIAASPGPSPAPIESTAASLRPASNSRTTEEVSLSQVAKGEPTADRPTEAEPAAAPPSWRPPFAIDADDFEPHTPAPVEPEMALAIEGTPVDATAGRTSAAPDRALPAPQPIPETNEPLKVEARPIRPQVALVPLEPEPHSETAVSLAAPAPGGNLPEPADAAFEAPETARSTVIEEVVAAMASPASGRAAPTAAQGRETDRTQPRPLSAEGASIIGPLPVSRRNPILLGMRRR